MNILTSYKQDIKKNLLKYFPKWTTEYGFKKKKIYMQKVVSQSLSCFSRNFHFNDNIIQTDSIYFFWWDGLENVPLIVNLCYRRLQKMNSSRKIIVIDKNNIYTYCKNDLNFCINLLEKGIIRIQYFSDILRTYLISKYGGIWMDATIFLLKPIENIIDNRPFFSYRIKNPKSYNPASGHWLGFFFASSKNNCLLNFINNGLIEIIKKKGTVLDYYTIDYLFKIAYEKSYYIRRYIKTLPYIKEDVINFSNINNLLTSKDLIVLRELPFLKLNWRTEISSVGKGPQSLYNLLLKLSVQESTFEDEQNMN